MENTIFTNEYHEQVLAMSEYIKSTPEVMQVAGEAAFYAVMGELAHNPNSNIWGLFDFIANAVADEVSIENAKRIAPAWHTDEDKFARYELIACALEEVINDLK